MLEAVTPSTSRASSTSTMTTRSRGPSGVLALTFNPRVPAVFPARPKRFASQAAIRIKAIIPNSAPLTWSSGEPGTAEGADSVAGFSYLTTQTTHAFGRGNDVGDTYAVFIGHHHYFALCNQVAVDQNIQRLTR